MLTAAQIASAAGARRKRVPRPKLGEFVSDFMIVLDYQTARKSKGNTPGLNDATSKENTMRAPLLVLTIASLTSVFSVCPGASLQDIGHLCRRCRRRQRHAVRLAFRRVAADRYRQCRRRAAVRDAGRIMDAAKDAGLQQIDHLITTHWHGDHFGGMAELAAQHSDQRVHRSRPQRSARPSCRRVSQEHLSAALRQGQAHRRQAGRQDFARRARRARGDLGRASHQDAAARRRASRIPYCASFKTGREQCRKIRSRSAIYVTFGKFRTYASGRSDRRTRNSS